MDDSLNILILSCGTRNKIVQYFRKELGNKGKVLATDCSNLAPALYDADEYFIVPRIDEEGYLDVILKLCTQNNVKAILSLIDPELIFLAENKKKFLDIGTTPIISDLAIIEMCFDKYKFSQFLYANGFNIIKTYNNKDVFFNAVNIGEIDYPVFVKPINGSASVNISKVDDKKEIERLFNLFDNLIIQEYMDGIEYGVDAYIDMLSEEPTCIFIKEKILMKSGETYKSVSIKDEKLYELIKSFIKTLGFKGIIDIDIFKVNDEYYISEVNPRFGGGYPHAYECGVNVPKMIINNLGKEKNNSNSISQYEEDIYMMKYNEVKIVKK